MSHRLIIWLRLITFVASVMLPKVVAAHAILEESSPSAGATVKSGDLTLQFRYNSRIDRTRSRLTLIRPDHSHDTLAIAPDGAPDIIRAHLVLQPGSYVIRWQVLAIDGHVTRGDVPITAVGP